MPLMLDPLTIKRRIGRLAGLLRARQGRKLILLYHSMGSSPWAVPPKHFRRQMEVLSTIAHPMPLSRLIASNATDRVHAAVTFDDGYASLYDTVRPIAREFGIPCSVFLPTAWIADGARRLARTQYGHYAGEHFMTWREAARLADEGWQIGSHGLEHLDLPQLSRHAVRSELRRSKGEIESRLGGECEAFAYPWGRHTAAVREEARQAGYRMALGTLHAPVGNASDPMQLPRMDIRADYSLDDFIAVLNGDWDYLGWLQRARRWISAASVRSLPAHVTAHGGEWPPAGSARKR